MKILVVADEESTYLWDYYDEKLFKDIDLIISAGDLKSKYLFILTTVSGLPVYYVPEIMTINMKHSLLMVVITLMTVFCAQKSTYPWTRRFISL